MGFRINRVDQRGGEGLSGVQTGGASSTPRAGAAASAGGCDTQLLRPILTFSGAPVSLRFDEKGGKTDKGGQGP